MISKVRVEGASSRSAFATLRFIESLRRLPMKTATSRAPSMVFLLRLTVVRAHPSTDQFATATRQKSERSVRSLIRPIPRLEPVGNEAVAHGLLRFAVGSGVRIKAPG